jgi:hypothetical protein
MTDRVVGKILACVLAVLLPAATMSAETHAAMLYTSNPVKVNGVGAERSSAVFAGDRIETPANTTVTLTSAGSTILVGPVSSLVYEGEALRLGSGSTVVTTEKGMKTQVQRLVILPAAQQRSSYGVIRSDGQVMIAAFHGSVKILDGASETIVADGDTASMPDPETSEQGGAQPAATTGRIGNRKMSTAALLLLLLGGAAAAGIIVYETTKTPVSGH